MNYKICIESSCYQKAALQKASMKSFEDMQSSRLYGNI